MNTPSPLASYSVHELANEISSRPEIVGVIIWNRDDVECHAQSLGYSEEDSQKIAKTADKRLLQKCLEDCSEEWNKMDYPIEETAEALGLTPTEENDEEW